MIIYSEFVSSYISTQGFTDIIMLDNFPGSLSSLEILKLDENDLLFLPLSIGR